MTQGKQVPNQVCAEIQVKFADGATVTQLAREFELSQQAIYNIIHERYKPGRKCRRPKKLLQHDVQRVLAYVQSHNLACCPEICSALGLKVSV